MNRDYHRVLLLFVDGVGLAAPGDSNPFASHPTPTFDRLLEGGLTDAATPAADGVLLRGIDAGLGISGLPQSATGQTALFTGVNGAARLGRHVTGFPGAELRRLVGEASLFRRVVAAGGRATFANAYTASYLEAVAAGRARASVTTCAVAAANLRWRTVEDLAAGRAVTWDLERDYFGRPLAGRVTGRVSAPPPLPPIASRAAGRQLGRLAGDHDLTVFETFLPDLVGHGRLDLPPAEVVRRLDELVCGALEERTPETTLVLTSDHGNFEDARVSTHTRAPVPLFAVGPAARRLARLESILDVTPGVLELLRVASS